MSALKRLSPSITDMIRFDHSHVMVTFHQYTGTAKPAVKKALAETICDAVEIHATLEEEIFYPVVRGLAGNEPVIRKSPQEHEEIKRLITELRATDAADMRHDSLMHELMRNIMHHVADEETVLLPEAERMLSKPRLDELGADMTRRRLELLKPKAGRVAKNTLVGFSGSTAAIVLGLASAMVAARFISRRPA